MPIHTLRRQTHLHLSLDEAWGFFSDPGNLAKITPPSLGFQVISPVPSKIYPGLMIEYRVRPMLRIPATWLTEITHVDDGCMFVDEQRVGPYRLWHHEHHFAPAPGGGVIMSDIITYALPFGFLGNMVHPWLVAPQLKRIFDHRQEVIDRLFPPAARQL
jgi:ligand-binding SRPBCC domain-containing protein